MKSRFAQAGVYKIGNKVREIAEGETLDVGPAEVERYTRGVHYDEVQPPAPEPAPAPEPKSQRKGGKGAGDGAEE